MKKKIYFVINNNIYIRNFIKTKIIKKLNHKFDVSLIFNKNLYKDKSIKKYNKNKTFFYSSSNNNNLMLKYHDIKSTYYKKNSKFFQFRLLRLYRYDIRYLNELLLSKGIKNNIINKIFNFHYLIKNFTLFLVFKILSTFVFFPVVKKYITNLPKNDSIEKIIKKLDGEIFIIPTSGYDADTIHFIDLLKKRCVGISNLVSCYLTNKTLCMFLTTKLSFCETETSRSVHLIKTHRVALNHLVLLHFTIKNACAHMN